RTCASWAIARASSRSPKPPPRTRWRCPSSRRWRRARWHASARSWPRQYDREPSERRNREHPYLVLGEAISSRLSFLMSRQRLRKDPDPRFWRLNRSLEFDKWLAPYDLDQSRAHARGLRRIGVLDAD